MWIYKNERYGMIYTPDFIYEMNFIKSQNTIFVLRWGRNLQAKYCELLYAKISSVNNKMVSKERLNGYGIAPN